MIQILGLLKNYKSMRFLIAFLLLKVLINQLVFSLLEAFNPVKQQTVCIILWCIWHRSNQWIWENTDTQPSTLVHSEWSNECPHAYKSRSWKTATTANYFWVESSHWNVKFQHRCCAFRRLTNSVLASVL